MDNKPRPEGTTSWFRSSYILAETAEEAREILARTYKPDDWMLMYPESSLGRPGIVFWKFTIYRKEKR